MTFGSHRSLRQNSYLSLLSLPITAFTALLMGLILKIELPMVVLVVLVSAAFNVFTALLGVVVNLRFPKFDYINETVVIKQSMSTMICMFGSMAVVLVLSLLYVLLLASTVAPILFLAICLALLAIACTLMWRYLAHGGSLRFAALQTD